MTSTTKPDKKKRKRSSVRHTRAIQTDRQKRALADNLPEHVEQLFKEIVHPLTLAQSELFRQMGLRERTLTLPVMMALFLMALWRQVAGVCDLVRLTRDEAAIWEMPQKVTQQAVSTRLKVLPAQLVLNVLNGLLPQMQSRWTSRERPLPPEVAWAQAHYKTCLIVDGSTLDALVRKVGLLRDQEKHPLAGKMTALLHLGSQMPHTIWYNAKATDNDQTFWSQILDAVPDDCLLIFDLGYTNFAQFKALTDKGVTFLTRAKSNLKVERVRHLAITPTFRDTIVWIGTDETRQQVRLIEVLYKTKWQRYMTNELDADILPARECVALYYRRWSIERAFFVVKRLLGLAYFWSGAQNAVEFQLWSTWIVYCILIDLSDEVAGLLNLPFERISIEMIYRSMYFYLKAVERGEADSLPIYLAHNAKHLGLVKRKRKQTVSVYDSWHLTTGLNP
jgi:hypothetical protein